MFRPKNNGERDKHAPHPVETEGIEPSSLNKKFPNLYKLILMISLSPCLGLRRPSRKQIPLYAA